MCFKTSKIVLQIIENKNRLGHEKKTKMLEV